MLLRFFSYCLLPAVYCLLLSLAQGMTPDEAVAMALTDLRQRDGYASQTRYLVLTGETEAQRIEQAHVASYVLNSISRARTIRVPDLLGKDARLVRLDLAAYADLKRAESYQELFAAWERSVEFDPYFHLRTDVTADGKETKTVTVDGGWVDLQRAAELRQISYSAGAVLRFDYWLSRAAGVDYYQWAGIPEKEADFFRQFGVDAALDAQLAADTAANLARSGVSKKPRRVIGRPGVFGAVLETQDVDSEDPSRDPFRNPVDVGGQKFKFQASEFFAQAPNRLWKVALYDAAGNRAATVPDRVAKDFTGDGIVAPFVTCIRCHELNGGAAGLQPFVDQQSLLLAKHGVESYLPEVTQRIAELYVPRAFGTMMARGRDDYSEAVALATDGQTPRTIASWLADAFSQYLDLQVTPAIAERELGLEAGKLPVAVAGSHDVNLLLLALGQAVNRAAWESSYHEAALKVIGTKWGK